ncbi:hemagglutinin repeat-containing protein [Campylobacter concisus]
MGANTNESTETKEKSKGFFSKKESHLMAINQKVISSNLNAGDISLKAGGNAIVTGSNLSAKNDINIDANNIGLAPTAYKNDEARSSSKKSFGGLKTTLDMHSLAKTNLQGSSLSTSQGDINLNANNDISIISSDIKGGRNVNLNAGNNLSILAAKEQIKEKSVHKSSNINIISLLTYPGMLVASAIDPIGTGSNTYLFEQMFGDTLTQIYRSSYNEKGSLDALAKLSNISAAKELNLKANEATITANLSSKDDTNIKANSIEISNAENEHSSYEISKSKGINLPSTKDLANDQKPKPIKEFKYDTSTKTRVADAEYEKSTTDVASTKAISSNLVSDKNINLNANEEIGITGSNLIAKEDINLISKNANIDILNSTDTTDISKTLKQAKAALSITAQNEYVEVAPASLALIEAIKQLKKVKKEYDSYKHTRDDLKDKLHELKQAYKSKTPGIDGSDIEDLSDILENINDEERYYKANIALAMANVEAKSLALVAQVAAAAKAASNWYTFGFSVGVAASVNGHKSKSNSNEVISNPSNLSANNIKIQTPNDTTITGSNLSANNLIDINTNNLNINSSKNTYTSESKDKSIGGTMRYTMYGGGGGSAGLNYSTSSSDTESLTNNNSHLYSAKDMNINTANDATIKGANLRADERLNLKVGNNLNLESVRDKYAYNERGYSVGVGIGFSSDKSPNSSFANPSSTKATSTNANFSRSSSNTITKQTVLSSITANELNVEVGKNTHLKGSLLAAGEYDKDNTFIDNHNLNLKTNTLSYENLSNTSYAKGTNFSIGANYILEDKNNKDSRSNNNQEDKFTGLKSIDLSNHRNLSYSLSKNLATLGSGNIEIADKENSDDLTRLNRDTTKLTKDLVNTSISSNVDGSMDLRVLTKSGQKDIAKEIVDANYGLKKLSEQMPDENSKNKIVSIMGKLLVYGSMVALDIIPTSYNNGGLFGQLVGSFGGKEIASDLISVFSKNSEKYELYKDKMVKLEDSKYFKTISPEKREELKKLSYFKDLYVSKEPLGIDVDTITHQNFGNGILNTPMEAIMNGLEQTGQIKKDGTRLAGNTIELTIKYNPTRGFFSDLLEAAQDKFSIGTSDMAKQVGSFISDVTKAAEEKRKKDNRVFAVNFAAHSQLNTLVYNGVKWGIDNELYRHLDGVKSSMKKGKGNPYTVSSFGSPVDVEKMRDVLEAAKIDIAGTFSNKDDFVAEGLGGNKDVNKKADMTDRINVLNIPKLFMDGSPHSSYVCQDYEKDGAICGVNFQ